MTKNAVMRILDGFELVHLENSSYILESRKAFNKIVTFNSSAAYLWYAVQDKDFSIEDLALLLADKYGISQEKSYEDAESIVEMWKKTSIII